MAGAAADPATKSDFEAAYYKWFKDKSNIQTLKLIHDSIKEPKDIERVDDFLYGILHAPWPEDEEPWIRVDVPGYNQATTAALARDVRRYLEVASKELWPDIMYRYLYVARRKDGHFLPCWKYRSRDLPLAFPSFSRIVAVGKLWPTGFSADFMRGAQAMARELGIELADFRSEYRTYDPDSPAEGSLLRQVEIERLTPERDAILICFDNPDEITEQLDELRNARGFEIVTTGHSNGTIHEDSPSIGRMLARQCIEDERLWRAEERREQRMRTVLVLRFHRSGMSSEHRQRERALLFNLQNNQELININIIDVGLKSPYVDAAPEAIRHIKERLKEIGTQNVAAIFSRVDEITRETIRLIEPLNPPQPRIYGEGILSSDLAILSREESPLWGVCGVEPYYYGRYAVRTASCRWAMKLPPIRPFLISKRDAVAGKIITADRIPAHFKGEDVHLNSEVYAWDARMKDRCPYSYGPDLFARR